jgi:hydroxymethylglutaryl-CoA lyase
MSPLSEHAVTLEEQGLRDGLQTLSVQIPLETKLRWIGILVSAGIRRLQVTSFVNPERVSQMADAEELVARLPHREGVVFSALVLNRKGVERAAAAGLRHISASLSASDTHSRRNANKGLEESKLEFREMARLAASHGIAVRGGIQCAFGCRYEGNIDEDVVLDLVRHHLDCGVGELALADSTGMGHPAQVKGMMEKVMSLAGPTPVSLHLHNTENKGYANLFAALEAGVRQFDTAFGGLGGCPFIKGATGNIATEDTVHMLEQSGFPTGIDMQKVAEVSREMEGILGKRLPGLLYGLVGREDIKMT